MGIFSMLSWGSMWSVFGFISLISMIWVAGPALQFSEHKPLEPLWARITLTAIVCLIFLCVYIVKWYKNKKLNENVIEEIKANEVEEPIDKDSQLKQKFSNIDLLLQKHEKKKSNNFIERLFSDKDEYIYQKPWFLFVGASGVGKTSAILNSGLTFPIGFEEDNASRLAGTRDCDWFLTDESLLLDTAGRFISHDNETSNFEDWNELLELLKRCRTKQPINGLVLTLSVDDILLGDSEKIKNQIQQTRLRLQELQESFKTSFPLYIVVNKVDLITGFTQYFNILSEQDRKKTFGIALNPLKETSAEKINEIVSQLDLKVEEIKNNLFDGIVYNNQEHDPSDLAMSFAAEFAIFNQSLKVYLKRLLSLSKYDSDINLAGLYFTSAAQNQSSELIIPSSSSDYKLRPKYIDNVNSTLVSKSQPYFLNLFFNTFLLNTANLAGVDNAWIKKRRKVYWFLVSIMAASFCLCCFLLFKSYIKNKDYLSAVSVQLEKLEVDLKVQPALNILDLLNHSHRVYEIPSHNIDRRLKQDSFIKNLGLNQYNDIEKASESKYQNLIDEKFIPTVSNTIDSELEKSVNLRLTNDIYKNLKVYLMLHQTEHYDKKYISEWVVENLNTSATVLEMDEASMATLQELLSSREILPNTSLDRALVERARSILANEDIASIIYTNLETNASMTNTESMPKVSFVSMGGPGTQSLFRRISNQTLNDSVPTLYTKYGYENIFKPFVGDRLNDFYQKENWVLGKEYSIQPKHQVLSNIYQKYTSNYVHTWKEYLDDIVMVNPDSLSQTVSMAKQLSEKNSSLAGIIKGVSSNTNLMPKTESESTKEKSDGKASEVKDLIASKEDPLLKDKLKEKINSSIKEKAGDVHAKIDDSKYQGYLQNVSSTFSQFQALTQSSAESESQLNEITRSINDLYIYSIALQRSLQKNDGLMPDDKPLINYEAQISRLPHPFQPMLNVLEYEVSKERENYFADKLQKEEAKIEIEKLKAVQQEEQLGIENIEQRRQFILQTAVEQDKIIQKKCTNTLAGKYPFSKSKQDLSLDEFTEMFSQKTGFLQTLGGNVAVVNESGMTPFISLLESGQLDRSNDKRETTYTSARKINSMYLTGANTPHLGISMKVIAMDKDIENLSVSYDGQKIEYYHGPQKNYMLNWPAKKNAQFSIKATSPKENSVMLNLKGDWSLFRLLDKAKKVTRTKDGKGVLAVFKLGSNNVEIEFKSVSGLNPFDLSLFRNYKC